MNSYRYVSIIVCQSLLVEINGFLVFSSVGGQFCHFCTDPVKRQIILTNIIDSTLEKQERYKPSLTAPLYNSHLFSSRRTYTTFMCHCIIMSLWVYFNYNLVIPNCNYFLKCLSCVADVMHRKRERTARKIREGPGRQLISRLLFHVLGFLQSLPVDACGAAKNIPWTNQSVLNIKGAMSPYFTTL